jgi:hypothetical protein
MWVCTISKEKKKKNMGENPNKKQSAAGLEGRVCSKSKTIANELDQ